MKVEPKLQWPLKNVPQETYCTSAWVLVCLASGIGMVRAAVFAQDEWQCGPDKLAWTLRGNNCLGCGCSEPCQQSTKVDSGHDTAMVLGMCEGRIVMHQ